MMSTMHDALEPRRLLSVALNTALKRIEITGSETAEVICVRRRRDTITILENGTPSTFPRADVTSNLATTGAGKDRVQFGAGLGVGIVVDGGDGDDVVLAGRDGVAIFGGAGNDRLFGGAGIDALSGGDGEDVLVGGAGNDLLEGGASDDLLLAGPGDDVLRDEAGRNDLRGGRGA